MSSDEKSAPSVSPFSPSLAEIYRDRILIPVLLAGGVGAGIGLVSKHRRSLGLAKISATYATNCAIVAGCYCGAREFVRVSRTEKSDDLLNSTIGGFCTGAILGRLQGGPLAAVRYSVIFAVVGTTVDYATLKLKPVLRDFYEATTQKEMNMPEWSPIRVLDEEEQAAKQAREKEIFDRIHNLQKGKS